MGFLIAASALCPARLESGAGATQRRPCLAVAARCGCTITTCHHDVVSPVIVRSSSRHVPKICEGTDLAGPGAPVLRAIKVSHRTLTITLRCGSPSCYGYNVQATTKERRHDGKVLAVAASSKTLTRTVVVLAAPGGLNANRTVSRTLRLNRLGRNLLAQHGVLPAVVRVVSDRRLLGSRVVSFSR